MQASSASSQTLGDYQMYLILSYTEIHQSDSPVAPWRARDISLNRQWAVSPFSFPQRVPGNAHLMHC